jgi:amidase
LDRQFESAGEMRPLHCVAMIVKENYDTVGMPTTAGSLSLTGSYPPDDAFQIKKLKEAGALVLAKSNMAEFAFSPMFTISSLAGTTRNAYALERVPAGSSGGTASAVAASFGTIGLGTDTGNSIRGPSSHLALVGIRSTIGATSRDGIVPLFLSHDIGGPMTRTVEDTAKVFQVIAGYDPADSTTVAAVDEIPEDYIRFLDPGGLEGARIGVLRALIDTDTADPEVNALMEAAIEDLREQGAQIVDPFVIDDFEKHKERQKWEYCIRIRHDMNEYLASLGPDAPMKTFKAIVESGKYHDTIEQYMLDALDVDVPPEEMDPVCLGVAETPRRNAFRDVVLESMDEQNVDAIVYPSWSNPPRLVGDLDSPHGNNSPIIGPHTGLPAITVPMGFTYNDLPAGLQLLGKPFAEGDLFKFAYAYEQATQHRHPPHLFAELE